MRNYKKYSKISDYNFILLMTSFTIGIIMIATEMLGLITYPKLIRYIIGIIFIITFIGEFVFRGIDFIKKRNNSEKS